jgi:hypothetical protein
MTVATALAGAGLAVGLAGSFSSAKGLKAAGAAAARTAEFNKSIRDRNAKVAELEADLRERIGGREEVRFRKKFSKLQARAATAFRKGGVIATSGTPLEVLKENADEAEEEVQTIKLQAATDSQKLREQGTNQRLAGDLAVLEGRAQQIAFNTRARTAQIQGISTLLSGGAQLV